MRTTVNIPDHLLVEAKRLAATRRVPPTIISEEGLRLYLSEQRRQGTQSSPLGFPLGDMGPPVEGIDLNNVSNLLAPISPRTKPYPPPQKAPPCSPINSSIS